MLGIYDRRRMRHGAVSIPIRSTPWGISAGFATTVANGARPVMDLFLLCIAMPKTEFIGTTAWFLFCLSLGRAPIYSFHGPFSGNSLPLNASMSPATAAAAATERWLFNHIPRKVLEGIAILLTAVAALALFR